MLIVMKRRGALKNGDLTYFTGKPCSNGHVSEKYTKNGQCLSCIETKSKISRMTDKDVANLFSYDEITGDVYFKSTGKIVRSISHPRNSKTKYYRVNVGGKSYFAHRIAWTIAKGVAPCGFIDHIDGNGLNNSLSNLRDVTVRENISNCRISSNNKSGVNGVWEQKGRFVAEIMVNRKKISLGSYSTLEEAKEARLVANIKYGFHDLHGSNK